MLLQWNSGSTKPGAGRSTNPAAPRTFERKSYKPEIEQLEDRMALSGGTFSPPIVYLPDQSPLPPPGALTPAQVRQAYGLNQVSFAGITGDGSGQTIAIIDAGDNPAFLNSTDPNFDTSDLHQFDQFFGLPDPPSFIKLNQKGEMGNYPPANVSGFAGEEALDIEWAHVIAPKANIVLIEANTTSDADLIQACIGVAQSLPQVSVVSMSFSGEEFADETQLDSVFTTPVGHQGITYLASSGDAGSYPSPQRPAGYPSLSPNVVSVGGTTLTVDASGNYIGETGWGNGADSGTLGGSGGGISQFEPQPGYQNGVVTQSTTQRTAPDVAFDADPNTGVAVFDSFDNGSATPWEQVGGTSLSCPCWAGIIAIADQDRAAFGLSTLDGPTQTLPEIYSLPQSDFHDITSGSNGSFTAGPGYDLVTGRGSPIGPLVIAGLAGTSGLIPGGNGGPSSGVKNFHPFRYIVDATLPGGGTVDQGNITVINTTNLNPTVRFFLLLGPLPDDVTLDPSVPTTDLPGGQVGIDLPVAGLPANKPVRVSLKFRNPHNVPISTFFEGFITVVTINPNMPA